MALKLKTLDFRTLSMLTKIPAGIVWLTEQTRRIPAVWNKYANTYITATLNICVFTSSQSSISFYHKAVVFQRAKETPRVSHKIVCDSAISEFSILCVYFLWGPWGQRIQQSFANLSRLLSMDQQSSNYTTVTVMPVWALPPWSSPGILKRTGGR